MNIAAIGTGIWSFLKRIPDWVLWALAAIIFLKFVDMRAEGRGRKDEREKQAVREAEQREILVETVNQLEQETEDAKDRALAAPDTIDDVASVGELREHYPDNAAVILRPRATSGGRGPL